MKTIEEFKKFVDDNNWIFAKTYADWAPHEYVVKDKLNEVNQELIPEVVLFIRENGFPAFFGNQEHTYFFHDGHYYWEMGDEPEETIIINRCKYDDYRMVYRKTPLLRKAYSMKEIYFSLAGTNNYYGSDYLKSGMTLKLVKEPENKHDKEAIRVELSGLGKIGYVANSPHTVLGECMSAGRIYDRIDDEASGQVLYVTCRGVVCELKAELKGDDSGERFCG